MDIKYLSINIYEHLIIPLNVKEADQVNRYLKKIEKDDNYVTSALGLANMMEEKVKQNIAVEIYTDYFLQEDVDTNWDEVGGELQFLSSLDDQSSSYLGS